MHKVEIITDKETITGVEMPSTDKAILSLKLESGYNIGIKKSRIKSIKVIEKMKKNKPVKQDKFVGKGKVVSILHTGGTIASKVDYSTGAVVPKFSPEEILAMFPELKNLADIKSRLIANMASDDLRFEHFNIISKEIQKEINSGAKGIVVTMGTDNLALAAAAIRFIFESLTVPVLFVGAQRSSDRGSSDAGVNLISAVKFITETDMKDVALCMHKTSDDNSCLILPALKTRKFHTSRRDAFRPINVLPFAEVEKDVIKIINKQYNKMAEKEKLHLFNEKLKIGILKIHPHMYAEEFLAYKKFDGLVLELTGLGHAPINTFDKPTEEHSKIKKAIKELAKKMPVVASPTCVYGRLDMNVYSPGRELESLGVKGNFSDMTTETTFIKLAWLLSNKISADQITKNLRGEISDRTIAKAYLY